MKKDWVYDKLIAVAREEKGSIRMGPFGSQLKKSELSDVGIKVYGQENVIYGNFSLGKRYVSKEKFDTLQAFELKADDVLVTMMGTIGHSIIFPNVVEKGIMDSHLLRIRVNKNKVVPEFLKFLFYSQYLKNQINSLSHGAIMKGLNTTIVKNLEIPVPPLPEQKAIAHILSTVQRAKEATEQVIEATKELKNSLMKHLFSYGAVSLDDAPKVKLKETEVGMVPEEWDVVRLDNVCTKIQDGSHFSPKIQYEKPGDERYLYITSKNIKEWGINLSDVSYVDSAFHQSIYHRCDPQIDDVLLIKDGVMTGIATLNTLEEEFSLLSSVVLLRANMKYLHPRYLKYFLNSRIGFNMITGEMTGSAIRRIILKKVKSALIPLPSISSQQLIAQILTSIEDKINVETTNKDNLEKLFKTLINNLMTGKIRVRSFEVPQA